MQRLLARAGQGGRTDDTAEVIRHRLQVFAETTSPLITYYQKRGILLAVDANQPPESVTAEIQARLPPPLAEPGQRLTAHRTICLSPTNAATRPRRSTQIQVRVIQNILLKSLGML